ncbi:MAG: FAD-dependent monooxygenase, partial [Pseudomonadota bacterium]|nr:FAD-dependent monooxygenase [Pseudomonadota bacterium]
MADMIDNARRTLVVGLGKTGLSVARYLSQHGVPVAIVDSRETAQKQRHIRRQFRTQGFKTGRGFTTV